jgi:hypothetical protein
MTHHRLGHQRVARQWLARALAQMERDADPAARPLWWDEQLRRQLLRREVEALLEGLDWAAKAIVIED